MGKRFCLGGVVGKLEGLHEVEIVPAGIVNFCMGWTNDPPSGMTSAQLANVSRDLQRQAEQVKGIGDALLELGPEMRPSGGVL